MTAARLPKDSDSARVHTHMPGDWLARVTRAAKKMNLTRSHYIAIAANESAKRDLRVHRAAVPES